MLLDLEVQTCRHALLSSLYRRSAVREPDSDNSVLNHISKSGHLTPNQPPLKCDISGQQ